MEGQAKTADMPPRHRVAALVSRGAPGFMARILRLGPARISRQGLDTIPGLVRADSPHDRAMMAAPATLPGLENLYRFALEQGADGFLADLFMTNLDRSGWLPDIRCPVVLLHGSESRSASQTAGARMARACLPGGSRSSPAQAKPCRPDPTAALRALQVCSANRQGAGIRGLRGRCRRNPPGAATADAIGPPRCPAAQSASDALTGHHVSCITTASSGRRWRQPFRANSGSA